jgi:excisionase family DNA binding protein
VVNPLAVSVEEAAKMLGIGKTLAYELVNQGVIPTIALGSKRVVPIKLLEKKLDEWCLNARNREAGT